MASQSVDRHRKVDVGINREFLITDELRCVCTDVLQTRAYKFTYTVILFIGYRHTSLHICMYGCIALTLYPMYHSYVRTVFVGICTHHAYSRDTYQYRSS